MGSGRQRRTSANDATARVEAGLRRQVRVAPGLTVLTGGQTGVDTYAAKAALQAGLSVYLVMPRGRRQEDGPLTAERERDLAGAAVRELRSPGFRYRTWTCAYLADAVLLLDPAGGRGCRETARAASMLGRPLLEPDHGELSAEQIGSWLAEMHARVLMLAGCRDSLLARNGVDTADLRADLSAIMAGARAYHDRLAEAQAGGGAKNSASRS